MVGEGAWRNALLHSVTWLEENNVSQYWSVVLCCARFAHFRYRALTPNTFISLRGRLLRSNRPVGGQAGTFSQGVRQRGSGYRGQSVSHRGGGGAV